MGVDEFQQGGVSVYAPPLNKARYRKSILQMQNNIISK